MKQISQWFSRVAFCLALSLLSSCQVKVEDIRFGEDQCHFCKMVISDPKFGSELVTEKGKVYKFDAAECMVSYLKNASDIQQEYAFVTAVAYDTPHELHDVNELIFLISPEIPSPMGAFLSAYESEEVAYDKQKENGGSLYNWKEVLTQVNPITNTNWKLSDTNE